MSAADLKINYPQYKLFDVSQDPEAEAVSPSTGSGTETGFVRVGLRSLAAKLHAIAA